MSQWKEKITGDVILDCRIVNGTFTNRSTYASSITNNNEITANSDIKPYFSSQSMRQTGDFELYLSNLDIDLGEEFTVSWWEYIKDYSPVAQSACMIGFKNGDRWSDAIPMGSKGYYSYIEENNGSSWINNPSNHNMYCYLNGWHHIAYTGSKGKRRLFIDGKLSVQANRSVYDKIQLIRFQYYKSGGSMDLYLDDIVFINNQCLWETNFEKPRGYLTDNNKSQYTDSVTGDILVNMRTIDNTLYDFPSDNFLENHWIRPEVPSSVELTNIQRKFSLNSIYLSHNKDRIIKNYENIMNKSPNCTGDFTFSCWFYNKSVSYMSSISYWEFHLGINNKYAQIEWMPILHIDGWAKARLSAYNNNNSEARLSNVSYPSFDAWHHLAGVRTGSDVYMFIDGQIIAHEANMLQSDWVGPIRLIDIWIYGNSEYQYPVYIDDYVFINGQALWTEDFDPPTYYLLGDYVHHRITHKNIVYPYPSTNGDKFETIRLY